MMVGSRSYCKPRMNDACTAARRKVKDARTDIGLRENQVNDDIVLDPRCASHWNEVGFRQDKCSPVENTEYQMVRGRRFELYQRTPSRTIPNVPPCPRVPGLLVWMESALRMGLQICKQNRCVQPSPIFAEIIYTRLVRGRTPGLSSRDDTATQ